MGLTDIRALCLEFSGREDLSGTGFDKYINAGQKMLDRLLMQGKIAAKYIVDIHQGDIIKTFEYCRSIAEVWIVTSDGRTQLTPKPLSWIKENYFESTTSLSSGIPEYFSPAMLRALGGSGDNPEDLSLETFHQSWVLDDVQKDGAWQGLNGVVFMPPSDGDYTIEIIGSFFSVPLVAGDTDISFWTENYPMLLAWAALYMLEVSYRNSEGAKDWMNAIISDITETNKDMIEEEVYLSNGEMGG